MKKISIEYAGGESRQNPETAVDYMMGFVDGVELYAEAPAGEEETANYEELKAEIIEQAGANGIDPERLLFWYDEEPDSAETMTIWRVRSTDALSAGYSFSLTELSKDLEGVTCDPVVIEVPEGFELGNNGYGDEYFYREGGTVGYELVSTSRWDPNCRPLLIGGDSTEVIHLRVVKG